MRRFFQRHLSVAFVAAVAVLLTLAAASYRSNRRSTDSAQRVVHTQEVLSHLNLLRADIAEGESASQGFVLTGDKSYIDSLHGVLGRTGADLKTLHQLTSDNPLQQLRFSKVELLMEQRLAAMQEIAHSRGRNEAAAAVRLLHTRSEPLVEEVRSRLREMADEESGLLVEELASSAIDARNNSFLKRIVFAVSLILLLTTFWFLSRSVAYKRLEAQRETFFQVSLDMLCFAGFDGYFQRLNPAWEKTLGFTIEELMAKPQIEFVHPDDREATRRQGAAVLAGASAISFENRFLCKDGSFKWLLWNAVPIPEQQIIYGVARDLTERKRTEALLLELSLTDALTNLRNRRGFLLLAEQELKLVRERRKDVHLWLIYADLDGLKQINDQMGHDIGSQAIVHTASILTESFRKADVIARLGGDEFAILALNNEPNAGDVISARIQERVSRFNAEKGLPYRLSLSLGAVKFDAERMASIDELVNEADRLMYAHKRSTKSNVNPEAPKPPVP